MKFSRLAKYAAWGLVALGLVLRLRQYLANRSLWLDEAMLALNIINKNVAGLFGKLDYNQGAPLGFLLLEKLVATLIGSGELALRLLPLLAGCAALVLFYFLAREMLSPVGTLAALALFAVSPDLIYYASEVKQYASDVLIALILLTLAVRVLRSPSRTAVYALLVVGVFSLWFSHPALFVLAAIGIVLLIENRQHSLPTLGMGAAWLASFGILYLVNLRQLSGNTYLLDYWREYFQATPLDAVLGSFSNPGDLKIDASILLIISLLGLVWLFKRNWRITLALTLTIAFTLAASVLGKYPFAGRMVLFAVPLVYLFLAAAIDWLANLFPKSRYIFPLLAVALAGTLLYAPGRLSAEKFVSPRYPEHIRPAMSVLADNFKPGDKLYLYPYSAPAWRYYAPRYGLENVEYLAGNETDTLEQTLTELDTLRGNARVWIIFSHLTSDAALSARDQMLAHLNQIGEKKRQFIEPGTSVYLYLYDLK